MYPNGKAATQGRLCGISNPRSMVGGCHYGLPAPPDLLVGHVDLDRRAQCLG